MKYMQRYRSWGISHTRKNDYFRWSGLGSKLFYWFENHALGCITYSRWNRRSASCLGERELPGSLK